MRTDEEIKTDILEELAWDPEVSMAEIGVSVHDGAVTLTGIVETFPERQAAERAVARVKGVVAIAKDIKVALSGEEVQDDSEVVRRIAHVLEWDPAIAHQGIRAEVRNGDVVLMGDVAHHFQRETIENHVSRIGGIRSVANEIRVTPQAGADGADTDIKDEVRKAIAGALRRHAEVAASHISVEVADGRVRLSGKVRTPYEKTLVTNAVGATPGIDAVVDDLRLAEE